MAKTKTRPTVATNDGRDWDRTPIWDEEFAARWEALQEFLRQEPADSDG